MTLAQSVESVQLASSSTPSRKVEATRLLASFDRLFELLDGVASSDDQARTDAMRALACFFRAGAAGLYVALQPGQSMELQASFELSDQAPQSLGASILTGTGRDAQTIVELRIVGTGNGVWSEAARDRGWHDVVVYALPRCPARLVVAYPEPAPKLVKSQVSAVLRYLATVVRIQLVQMRVEGLEERLDEFDHLVATGINLSLRGIVLLDSRGKIVSCNAPGGQLLGYAVDEIVGLSAGDILVSRSDINELVKRALSAGRSNGEHQLTLFHRYGEPLPVRLQIVPLRASDRSSAFGAIVLFADRRSEPIDAVERNLQEKNAQLQRMISILAHEIRNPLGGIKAGLEFLEPALQGESAEDDLAVIHGEIRRIDRLLQDALLVSRTTELQLDLHRITDVLDDLLVGRRKVFADQSITVRRQYDSDLPPSMIDRVQIEQVLDNLIINAIHAMPNGGVLTVSAGIDPAGQGHAGKRHQMLEVKVMDSGAGIPQEMQSRIFDPFFSTKKGGTGLGLSVARNIVGQHNGTLNVASWPEAGTIFTIKLPVGEESLD
jgi:PAS domain S-box-containing protein